QIDANAGNAIKNPDVPRRGTGGGYKEHKETRTAGGTATRPLGRRLTAKVSADVSLEISRSTPTDPAATPPTPRDNYRQGWRTDVLYNPTERFNTGVALDVGLIRAVNLPASSTSNNTDTRSYRTEWRWSYRLMRGLTASQVNTVQADYQFFPF